MKNKTLALRLAAIREAKEYTQGKMAELMGVKLRAYQRYEKGDQIPGADKLEKMTCVLKDINANWLLTGQGQMFIIQESKEPPPIDQDALRQIIRAIDEFSQRIPMSSQKKAEWITIIYDHCMKSLSEDKEEIIERFLRLVS